MSREREYVVLNWTALGAPYSVHFADTVESAIREYLADHPSTAADDTLQVYESRGSFEVGERKFRALKESA